MYKFKIRCSAISQIMTDPKTKKAKEAGELSQTAKTYCETWLKEQLYKQRKEFSSKYTEKGNQTEDSSIDFLKDQGVLGAFDQKNEEYKSNDYIGGTCDVDTIKDIVDLKNSWDCFSFPLFQTSNKNKAYEWQLQGYMELWQRETSRLIYCLTNTPEELVDKEIYYATNEKELTKEEYEEIETKTRAKHNYSNLDPILRYKIFSIERDKSKAESIKARVAQCQTYINYLLNQIGY